LEQKIEKMTASQDINNQESENRHYTLEEYFEYEYKAEGKHEFHNGLIVEMSYTSESHGIIVHNLDVELGICLKSRRDCLVIPNDRMVYIPACKKVCYPDLVVVCGERAYYQYSKNMKATLNPTILIEVLSDSTKNHDKKGKRKCYRTIPSLNQYIIVDQDTKFVEVYERSDNGHWYSEIYFDDDDVVKIGDCQILLKDIYHKVELAEGESKSDN
jgi:Uma2 family endonuclease